MQPKLYLAGPEVFLPNAAEDAKRQRTLCEAYGFEPLHPMDNDHDLENAPSGMDTAIRIYLGNVEWVKACDIVVANCNPFRGVCTDDGTAYELGYGNALGKPSYGFINELTPLLKRTVRDYPYTQDADGLYIDKDGYAVVDDFGTSINLMMQCGMLHHNGRLIEGDFAACLAAIRADLDAGALTL